MRKLPTEGDRCRQLYPAGTAVGVRRSIAAVRFFCFFSGRIAVSAPLDVALGAGASRAGSAAFPRRTRCRGLRGEAGSEMKHSRDPVISGVGHELAGLPAPQVGQPAVAPSRGHAELVSSLME